MARWLPGSLVNDIRGRLGGDVYSFQRGVNYIKSHCATPYNPQTFRQQQIRGWVSALSGSWSTLTPGEQALWNQYGSRQRNSISGFAAYMKNNMRWAGMSMSSTPLIRTPPRTVDTPTHLVGLTLSRISGTQIRILWTSPRSFSLYFVCWFTKNWDYSPWYNGGWCWAAQGLSSVVYLSHNHPAEPAGTVYKYHARIADAWGRYSPISETVQIFA